MYNPEIHHRKSLRKQGYDYSQAGLYFITICCQDRRHLFGKIENCEMQLNDAGIIANQCWLDIVNHFPHVKLHEYIIMPDHVHGIIEITDKINLGVEYIQPLNLPPPRNEFQKIIPLSIGSIVKGFKIGVTKWFRINGDQSKIWQRNYHERVIYSTDSFERVSKYIKNNPRKWNLNN